MTAHKSTKVSRNTHQIRNMRSKYKIAKGQIDCLFSAANFNAVWMEIICDSFLPSHLLHNGGRFAGIDVKTRFSSQPATVLSKPVFTGCRNVIISGCHSASLFVCVGRQTARVRWSTRCYVVESCRVVLDTQPTVSYRWRAVRVQKLTLSPRGACPMNAAVYRWLYTIGHNLYMFRWF